MLVPPMSNPTKRLDTLRNHLHESTTTSTFIDYDIIIRGGMIFDGLRTPRFISDVGIKDGVIKTIGSIPTSATCGREIDAKGKHVAPGFVDLHTVRTLHFLRSFTYFTHTQHYDSQIFWDPYCTLSGWHGVTSVVIGKVIKGSVAMMSTCYIR